MYWCVVVVVCMRHRQCPAVLCWTIIIDRAPFECRPRQWPLLHYCGHCVSIMASVFVLLLSTAYIHCNQDCKLSQLRLAFDGKRGTHWHVSVAHGRPLHDAVSFPLPCRSASYLQTTAESTSLLQCTYTLCIHFPLNGHFHCSPSGTLAPENRLTPSLKQHSKRPSL